MDLSPDLRRYLVSELRRVAGLMTEQATSRDKAYYYSGAYGAVNHVLNINPHPELVLLLMALQTTHANIATRVEKILQGQEPSVGLTEAVFNTLTDLIMELADKIDNDHDFSAIVSYICVIGFVTTGNGYFLYASGRLSIPITQPR